MYDVIVIGGGPAGVTAALRAGELGAKVALVERNRLGGTCTNDGCVPTRVLAKAARLMRETGHFGNYGLVGEAPSVDFAKLMNYTQQTIYRMHEKKQLIANLERAGVRVYAEVGNAKFVAPHTISLEDGNRLNGEKFIICAGGHARKLSFPGSELALTHHDIWSRKKLPDSLAVIGGAATGSQVASIFAALGSEVWLLERNSRLLKREDSSVSAEIEAGFRDHGIRVITQIDGVRRIEKNGADELTLWYAAGDQVHPLRVETIIIAAGWPGNADTLNLSAAGVETERGYVSVDDCLRTSAPHIFAAGDINGRMMLVQSSGYEARLAAENAVLGPGQYYTHQIVPHGGFTDPEYASVGLTEDQARAHEPDCVVTMVPYADLDRAVIDDHARGFCKLIVSQKTHRILGAHIVGEQALEAVQLVAAGMASDMWVEQLADLELAYPTYTGIVGLAARRAVRELGVVPLAPQWRTLRKPSVAEWEHSLMIT